MPRGRRKGHGRKRSLTRRSRNPSIAISIGTGLCSMFDGVRRLFGISAPISQVRDAYGSEVAEAYASQVSINTSPTPKIEILERAQRVIVLEND